MGIALLASSNFNWFLDGGIVGLYLLITMIAGVAVRRYVGKVEHFLVAGREMNLFLGIASLAATEFGIVTCMYTAQAGYDQGFAGATPGILQAIAMLLIGWTGFCVKPLRDSGAMTIPELFEQRFGSTIRWLSGVVIVLGGLLNMGVFLRIGGEFLVLVSGMNEGYLVPTMTILLIMVSIYTILGGMLSVLVTDFLQFIVMSVGMLAVTFLILYQYGWTSIVDTVEKTHGAAGFNPFARAGGWEFVLGQLLVQTAATLTWQTTIARLLAAKDTKTGQRVYMGTSFFFVCRFLIPGIWGLTALMVLAPSTVEALPQALQAKLSLSGIDKDPAVAVSTKEAFRIDQRSSEELQKLTLADLPTEAKAQVAVSELPGSMKSSLSLYAMPYVLGTILPIGLMGLLIAAMLAADMSTDSSYMVTWASVIYNDILAPFRKRITEQRGLLLSRMIVALIGVFLFFYGLFYKLEGSLWDYLTTTGTVYLSSMSVLLVACCYWRRANNWGAAAAILTGSVLPIVYLALEQIRGKAAMESMGLNQDRIKLAAFLAAAVAMVVFSLLKPTRTDSVSVHSQP
jgi:SSS family solute:Na+ symporter